MIIPYHVLREDAYEPVVLWDGTKNGPGGRYLSTTEQVARPPEPPTVRQSPNRRPALADEIVRCLRVSGPMTVGELARALSTGRDQVWSRLGMLCASHLVVVVGTRRHAGGWRQAVHLYALHDQRTCQRPDGGA